MIVIWRAGGDGFRRSAFIEILRKSTGFPLIEWAQFWAQSVSTAHALVNPVLSPRLETCRRRWPPILCLEIVASVSRWSCSSTMRARPPSWTTSSCRLARHERSVPTRLFVRKPKKKSDAQPSRSDALYGVFRTGRLKISARGAARLLGLSDQLTQNEVEER